MKKTVLFIDNTAHHLYGQLHNIQAIHSNGYNVVLLIPDDGIYFTKLSQLGYKCIDAIQSWRGQNPLAEFLLLMRLKKVINELKPDIICTFTIKPNLYTAILNKRMHIKQIANITGLGYGFMKSKLKAFFFAKLYKFAIAGIDQVFFQNKDDYNYLTKLGVFSGKQKIDILPGSGVDLNKFPYSKPIDRDVITFLFSGRILADKGIYELVDAFNMLKQRVANVELIIIGNFFPDNPSAIPEVKFNEWINSGLIKYLGMIDNVAEQIALCDCLVLPSHREGMPRSILEASSIGRAVITVNSIGCKDAVDDGVTGFIAEVKDAHDLFMKMHKFVTLPYAERVIIGENGRKKVEQEFDQTIVIEKYLQTIKIF